MPLKTSSNDFRNIPVFPDNEDMEGGIPILRPNIVHGRYQGVEDYLDVIFRLMREDFIRPLREAIQNFKYTSKHENIRMFNYVTLTQTKNAFQVNFDVKPFNKTDWETEKILMHGSLVAFSLDSFKTMIFGTVVNRNPNKLKNGEIKVQIENPYNLREMMSSDRSIVMIESKAYFGAYRHVLDALQSMDEDNLPFKDYIVYLSQKVKLPRYIKTNEYYYCLCPMFSDYEPNNCNYSLQGCYCDYPKMYPVLQPQKWPSYTELGLDQYQFEAYKMALTKSLAVIQGPPGTGKTKVGLKIVETLVHNSYMWKASGRCGQILVICFTNHALDQFMEGIFTFTESIARIGGQCKSAILSNKIISNFTDCSLVSNIQVIGMTTTAAAKHRNKLLILKPQIVIVEEAAEVMEAHIVSALQETTQQLILIGDHQQLRPHITVYELAKKYHLDISLFERLVNNGVPFCRLGIQHRMKPCISNLLVPFIYNNLEDHDSVFNYEDIKGMDQSMFFINHNRREEKLKNQTTHANLYEAQYLAKLCRYLFLVGYHQKQITVLATYSGQILDLKRIMNDSMYHGVHISTVDNYQGEENDIILLSLVRSNQESSVGFLKVENRVCVALSRAKKGLYCIGNFNILEKKSQLWRGIIQKLKCNDEIGPKLKLKCLIHNQIIAIENPQSFDDVFTHGCGNLCNKILNCGHQCGQMCHILDPNHVKFKCKKLVLKSLIPCGHQVKVYCSDDVTNLECKSTCSKILSCGHKCRKLCGLICSSCNVPCAKVLSCGHKCRKLCGDSCYPCNVPCPRKLNCGHSCSSICGLECRPCRQLCSKILRCGHRCTEICNAVCGPCKVICSKTLPCGHICKKSCGYSCSPCIDRCSKILSCGHECRNMCAEDCGPCYLPCQKVLKCGHVCHKYCHEKCEPCDMLVTVRAPCKHSVSVYCYKSVDKEYLRRQCERKIHSCSVL